MNYGGEGGNGDGHGGNGGDGGINTGERAYLIDNERWELENGNANIWLLYLLVCCCVVSVTSTSTFFKYVHAFTSASPFSSEWARQVDGGRKVGRLHDNLRAPRPAPAVVQRLRVVLEENLARTERALHSVRRAHPPRT